MIENFLVALDNVLIFTEPNEGYECEIFTFDLHKLWARLQHEANNNN